MRDRIYTPEEIQQKFDSLPPDIQGLVYSADMLKILGDIGNKYQLHIDQAGTLEAETADVMTGFTQPEEFSGHLKESLGIDDSKAEAIVKDLNEQLFSKIRESMKALRASQPTAPAAASNPVVRAVPPPAPPALREPIAPPAAAPVPPSAPKPTPPSPSPVVDTMLSQPTVTVPKPSSSNPPTKPDPYREPAE